MFREFFSTFFLCVLVAFFLQAGILILAPLYGWWGVIPFVGINVAGAYFFNKARKTERAGGFDDKTGSRRMDASSAELMGMMMRRRETERKGPEDVD